MKYKIGDVVSVKTETRPNGCTYVLTREPNPKSTLGTADCQIIGIDKTQEAYLIKLEGDLLGWFISDFHVLHVGVAKAFRNCKFFYVTDEVVEKK